MFTLLSNSENVKIQKVSNPSRKGYYIAFKRLRKAGDFHLLDFSEKEQDLLLALAELFNRPVGARNNAKVVGFVPREDMEIYVNAAFILSEDCYQVTQLFRSLPQELEKQQELWQMFADTVNTYYCPGAHYILLERVSDICQHFEKLVTFE